VRKREKKEGGGKREKKPLPVRPDGPRYLFALRLPHKNSPCRVRKGEGEEGRRRGEHFLLFEPGRCNEKGNHLHLIWDMR